jgi:hypothetical protein
MGDMDSFRPDAEVNRRAAFRVRWSDWVGRTHATGTTDIF